MINYWKACFQKYADFNGRARRSEYWYFTLMNIIIMIPLYIVAIVFFVNGMVALGVVFIALYMIYVLGTFVPSLASIVRRLHDIGKSGWMFCVSFIPLAGPIWLLVLLATDSQPGDNEYGPNPKTSDIDLINTIK